MSLSHGKLCVRYSSDLFLTWIPHVCRSNSNIQKALVSLHFPEMIHLVLSSEIIFMHIFVANICFRYFVQLIFFAISFFNKEVHMIKACQRSIWWPSSVKRNGWNNFLTYILIFWKNVNLRLIKLGHLIKSSVN